ncbi:MAG: hypothetical protein ACREX9_18210 [Gammaproteobacteria bacterium]
MDCISKHGRFMRRAQAESDSHYVQIVPGGVLRYETGVFLFQRKETDPKYRLYGKNSIWQGCHVSRREGVHVSDLIEKALLERLARSLFLSRVFPIKPLGYCWDRDDPSSGRHFGLIYEVEINNPHTAVDLRKKEFRKQRGHGWSGKFDEWSMLAECVEEPSLESWSRAILRGTAGTS